MWGTGNLSDSSRVTKRQIIMALNSESRSPSLLLVLFNQPVEYVPLHILSGKCAGSEPGHYDLLNILQGNASLLSSLCNFCSLRPSLPMCDFLRDIRGPQYWAQPLLETWNVSLLLLCTYSLCSGILLPLMRFCSDRIGTDCWHYGSQDIVRRNLAVLVGVMMLALCSRARISKGKLEMRQRVRGNVRKVQKMILVAVNTLEILWGLHTLSPWWLKT